MSSTRDSNYLPFYNPLSTATKTNPAQWSAYNLLMPICAVGNVGQLACDLIIATLLSKGECRLVGRIYSPALMSVVGPNAFRSPLDKGEQPVTTSTEVYESQQHQMVIIQQRTSYFKNMKHSYVEELVSWIRESGFRQVFVLTSSFDQCNPDISQLGVANACPIQSMTTNSFRENEKWTSLGLKSIPDSDKSKIIQDGLSFLPGSGLTKSLKKALERANIPAAFIVDFCSEGINIRDCYQVAALIRRLFSLDGRSASSEGGDDAISDAKDLSRGWVEPYSWNLENNWQELL